MKPVLNDNESANGLLQSLMSYLRLVGIYVQFNFKSQWEYRSAFASQVVAMIVNDCFWLVFWIYFYKRFPVLGSWNQNDLITMWALAASGFGLAHGIAGNVGFTTSVIVKGQLDTWMLYPRALLPHLLLGKMHVTAWGDVIFGVLAYVLLVHPSPASFALFIFLMISIAILWVGFGAFVGSLAFFLGNAEGLSEQLRFALITFSTYPPAIFDGVAKLVLFTVIPAGFCSYLPVEALKTHSLLYALLSFGGSLVVLLVGVVLFYTGLRRYESGNLMEMRG